MPLDGSWLMNNVPVDIFREVFSSCVDSVSFPLRGAIPMQLSLSQVCGYWREIMLDNPWMWNEVTVGPLEDYDEALRVSSQIDEWLSRSGDSLISLDLGSLMGMRLSTTQNLLHKHRFKKLGLYIPLDQLSSLFKIPVDNLSHIEELRLLQGYAHSESFIKRPFFPAHEFPLLKSLTTDVNPEVYDMVHALSWGQLRSLEIRADVHSAAPCMEILRHCPLLEVFLLDTLTCALNREWKLKEASRHALSRPDNKPVFLPHLNQLSIQFVRSDFCDMILGSLVLPELNILSLFYVNGETTKLKSLEGLATGRLGPRLQELSLKDSLDVAFVMDIIESRYNNSTPRIGFETRGSDHAFQAPQATLKRIDLCDADIKDGDQERIDKLRSRGLEIYTGDPWY
ncbi:hypothetical protein F5887DRAFT_1248931 [Amanita rubescens]|nr:hypothetical protein F5887DRAFT_1248931 [Amanita rubescens]